MVDYEQAQRSVLKLAPPDARIDDLNQDERQNLMELINDCCKRMGIDLDRDIMVINLN